MVLRIRRSPESGALACEQTQSAINLWARAAFFRGFICVALLYAGSFTVNAFTPPAVIGVSVVFLMSIFTVVLLAAMVIYLQISWMRTVLARREWTSARGASKMLYAGPFPLAHVVVLEMPEQEPEVMVVYPRRHARQLPSDLADGNMAVLRWRRSVIVSSADGGNPCFTSRVRGRKLRATLIQLVNS